MLVHKRFGGSHIFSLCFTKHQGTVYNTVVELLSLLCRTCLQVLSAQLLLSTQNLFRGFRGKGPLLPTTPPPLPKPSSPPSLHTQVFSLLAVQDTAQTVAALQRSQPATMCPV